MNITLPELSDYEKPYAKKTKDMKEVYIDFCNFFSKRIPLLVKPSTKPTGELKDAINFLNWDLEPYKVINLSRWVLVIGLVFAALLNALLLAVGYFSLIVTLFIFMLPPFLAYLITKYPKDEARFERIEALGQAPNILTQLVIYLKQNPNLEKALHFVSKYSSGKMINDLKKKLWTSLMGHKINLKQELGKIAQKWGETLVELKRSIYLIVASVSEKNEIKRNSSLDRAIKITLDGVLMKITEYTQKLYLPTLFLFSFGTILPLVIISLLPIFSFFGNEFTSPLQLFLLLILSLAAIFIYSNSIIAKRPPTFSTIKLPEFLKVYPKAGNMKFKLLKADFEVNARFYLTALFLLLSFPGILFLISQLPWVNLYPGLLANALNGINTLTIIWAFGIVIALYAYGTSWYKKKIRDEIEELEKEMIDGIYQLASRISEGRSPESAIQHLAKTMPNTKFGSLMEDTYRTIKSRHTTIEDALFNHRYGTLRGVYSNNFKLVMRIFVNSLRKGIDYCAQTLFTMSDHFDKLKKTEAELKQTLKNSLSMMKITASVFAPMITGLVITLQQLIQTGLAESQARFSDIGYEYFSLSFLQAPALSLEILQLIAGVYMIILAIMLIRYVVLLEFGKDEIVLKTEIAKNVPIALFIFTFTLIFSRIMLG